MRVFPTVPFERAEMFHWDELNIGMSSTEALDNLCNHHAVAAAVSIMLAKILLWKL